MAKLQTLPRWVAIVVLTFLLLFGNVAGTTIAAGFASVPADPQPQMEQTTIHSTSDYAGEVFLDSNLNGIREFSENGVGDITVVVETPDGEIVKETTSDADGFYIFRQLPRNQFRVRVSPPRNYQVTSNGSFMIALEDVSGPAVMPTGVCVCLYIPHVSTVR